MAIGTKGGIYIFCLVLREDENPTCPVRHAQDSNARTSKATLRPEALRHRELSFLLIQIRPPIERPCTCSPIAFADTPMRHWSRLLQSRMKCIEKRRGA